MKVNWNAATKPTKLKFVDIQPNQAFKNKAGRGAVYVKVVPAGGVDAATSDGDDLENGLMYELATGKLFPPTEAELELVDVELNVAQAKPVLRGY